MMMSVEQLVERLAEKTEVLTENLPQCQICPPQTPRDLTWARNRAATVGSRRLTA
jgi:hypothetical protein